MAWNSCLDCVRKHLSTAWTFINETHLGYPEHRWLAVGELTHASLESADQYPEFSKKIRDVATLPAMQSHDSSAKVDIFPLIIEACVLADEDDVFNIKPNRSKMYAIEHLTDQALAVLRKRILAGDERCYAWVKRACPQYLVQLTTSRVALAQPTNGRVETPELARVAG
jgi:hypothetical protein